MPDNGTYEVAVLPGSQDGQGKVCVCLICIYFSLFTYLLENWLNSTGCLICGCEQSWMDIQLTVRIPLDSGLGTVLKFLKFY